MREPATSTEMRGEYARIAAAHARAQEDKERLPLAAARANALKLDWSGAYQPPKPSFLGTKVLNDYPIAELIDYIDWTPFFSTWELSGQIPGHSRRRQVRRRPRAALYEDARAMLRQDRRRELVQGERGRSASGRPMPTATTSAFMPTRRAASRSPCCIRCASNLSKREGRANVALADFVAPRDSGLADYIGGFAVTAGIGEDEVAERFKRANDDYSAIMVKALADRLAEAFAERLHQRVRKEFWGYAPDEALSNDRAHRREISRHPPGAGLSGAARPHREGHVVQAAREPSASASS